MSRNEVTRRQALRSAGVGASALALGALGARTVSGQVATIGEVGTVITNQSGPGEWHTEQLDGAYATKPAVVMKPISPKGGQPCHVRLRNVTTDSFEYQIEEWNYLDGGHTKERFSYVAVEPGLYTLSGPGTGIEAGQVPVDTTAQQVTFEASYDQEPVVLTQSQTREGPDAIVTRTEVSSRNAFSTQLQEEEGGDGGGTRYHKTETVGYIAFERPASGILDVVDTKFEIGRTPNAVTDEFYRIDFQQTYDGAPRVIADMQTVNGPDTAGLRYRFPDMNSIDMRVEEERSADNETNHTNEQVGYAVFGQDGALPGTVGI